jgi:hypothetical protein
LRNKPVIAIATIGDNSMPTGGREPQKKNPARIFMTKNQNHGNHRILDAESPFPDDMRDGEDLQKLPEPLQQALSYIHNGLFGPYTVHNNLSLKKQRAHRIFSCLAVFCGSAAIILAILQVFLRSASVDIGEASLRIFELVSFSVAVIAVGVAVGSNMHKEWLKQRYLAEQYRSLKFRALIHPDLWCVAGNTFAERFEHWKGHFNRKVSEVKKTNEQTLEICKTSDEISRPIRDMSRCAFDGTTMAALVHYYATNRLSSQQTYFKKRLDYFETIERSTGWIPNFCFIASIFCAAVHFGTDFFFLPSNPGLQIFSYSFLLLTLVFPIFAIGTRTLRSSIEVSRSAVLFRAKAQALERFSKQLDDELRQNTVQWAKIITILWQCEGFFENENREWLRMMSEAEWFL